MAILPFSANASGGVLFASDAQKVVRNVLAADARITLLERANKKAVIRELEYQKSEEFIDGTIVEQGKAIGARYLINGTFDVKNKVFTLKAYDVSNGLLLGALNVKGEKVVKNGVSRNIFPTRAQITKLTASFIEKYFPKPPVIVVRPTKASDSKVKELLIAGGLKFNLKKGIKLEIFVVKDEIVQGESIQRTELVGTGTVSIVEGDHFSRLKVESGGRQIKELLDNKEELLCRNKIN